METNTHGFEDKLEQHSFMGLVWCAGWLFSIGFMHLRFWKVILSIVLWPHYLGVHYGAMAR